MLSAHHLSRFVQSKFVLVLALVLVLVRYSVVAITTLAQLCHFVRKLYHTTGQYAQQTVQGVGFVISLSLLHSVNVLTKVTQVTFALIRLGHLHLQYHLPQQKVAHHQQNRQYRLGQQRDWRAPPHPTYAMEAIFSWE